MTPRHGLLGLTIAIASLSLAGRAFGQAAPAPAPRYNLGLVVSGGVSEGSYQAGSTYALLRYYQKANRLDPVTSPDLTVASGASAGNVNVVLASTFWLAENSLQASRPLDNIFFNTWANVGWDRLAPIDNDWCSYPKMFGAVAGQLDVPAPKNPDPKGKCIPVYTGKDGVVTGWAFDQVMRNARKSLQGTWLPQRHLSLGITLTSETTVRLELNTSVASGLPDHVRYQSQTVAAQRFVVPFGVDTPGPEGKELLFRSAGYGWTDQTTLGKVKYLPLDPATKTITPDTLFNAVRAAAAFPVAFGPLHVPKDDPGPRFWDGGWFDNVPVGLALSLNADPKGGARPLAFMYIDAGTRRGQRAPERAAFKHGLDLVLSQASARLDEGRRYELEAIRRFDPQANTYRIQMTDRFYPLTSEQLPFSFGAFLQVDFRRYDYLVGLYDGVFTLAAGALPDEGQAPKTSSEWLAFFKRFDDRLNDVTCQDPCRLDALDLDTIRTRNFVQYLFAKEVSARAPGDVSVRRPVSELLRPQPTESDPTVDAWRNVWALHDQLYRDLAQRRADLADSGDLVGQTKLEDDRGGLEGFLRHIPGSTNEFSIEQHVDPRRDPTDFMAGEIDRLVRRQIDIERSDQDIVDLAPASKRESARFTDLLHYSRLVSSSLIERSRTWIGDGGTATRLGAPSWLAFLMPQFVDNRMTTCAHEVGWEPKLRYAPGYKPDGRHWYAGWYLGSQAAWEFSGACGEDPSWARWRFGVGPGFDPPGRVVDDLQVLFTSSTSKQNLSDGRGLEVAATLLTKLRLGFGWEAVWGPSGQTGPLPHGFYVTLGLADVGGVATWIVQTLLPNSVHGNEEPYEP